MTNQACSAVSQASENRFRVRYTPTAIAFVSGLLLMTGQAWADFKAAPAARVIPNQKIEIRWIAPFVGHGVVRVFDNPDGSGTPIDGNATSTHYEHVVDFTVGGVIAPDTTYYFKVTHIDPTGVRSDLSNEAPLPSFFTGAQPPAAEPGQPKLTTPNDEAGMRRASVAIDGDTVVVGAPGFSESAAHVFVKPESGWSTTNTPAAKLAASDAGAFALFGKAVAVEGDTVVVTGSCAAYVFVKPVGGWTDVVSETAKLTASNVACLMSSGTPGVAIDGDTVVVGAENDDDFEGSAYVFMKPPGGWAGIVNETAKLSASDGAHAGGGFGGSVAVDGDGVLIGAAGKASAYLFLKPAGGWAGDLSETAKLTASDPVSGTQFGGSVAISGDSLVVGDLRAGYLAAYVFVKPPGGWTGNLTETARLTAADGEFLDDFGASVAISGDTILIGAPGHGDARGAAYVFLEPAEGWAGSLIQAHKLTASDGEPFDFVGNSVAISGDAMVVGADEWGDFQAAAYVFANSTAPTDSTAPVITPIISGTLGNNGWYLDDVGVNWDVEDAESTIMTTLGCDPSSVTSDTTGTTFICTATTAGGTASESVTVMLDKTPPAVACGAPDGLWHKADLALGCTADDSISGLANAADANFNLTTSVPVGTEDANAASNSRTVYDKAGNFTATGSIAGNKVDKKAPEITIDAPAAATYLLNQAVASDYFCTDGGSGVASCAGPVPSGQDVNTAVAGVHSFTVNASDQVANATTRTSTYQVQYQPAGASCHGSPGHQILAPINADGSSIFNQKSTVPAKFRVCDANGVSIGTPGLVSGFSLIRTTVGTMTSDVNETVLSTTPDAAFRWDSADQQWVFNLSNRNLAPNATYVFRISLNDGTHIDFQYGLR